ncbi:hypothetical protein PIIN_11460 [Serendipita indica DSM 11827]|uniref:Uncharacterized protein n=1 Tax=Serendipita indica (strain DSM 11827) TaxID=1109443 RepID=G4U1P0_SERID|nr:hypothetical protein PIIN_11460 [Serendipita indica DSM 11827]
MSYTRDGRMLIVGTQFACFPYY